MLSQKDRTLSLKPDHLFGETLKYIESLKNEQRLIVPSSEGHASNLIGNSMTQFVEASPISDTALMLDIMFIVQGLSGKFLRFHPSHDSPDHSFYSDESIEQVIVL